MIKSMRQIKVVIDNKDDLYNKFDSEKLADDLGIYIYECSREISRNDKITINVYTNFELSDTEQSHITKMLKSFFRSKINQTKNRNKFDNIKKTVSFIIGATLIFLSQILYRYNLTLVGEILSIIGWVAIWEVFDDIITNEARKKISIARLNKIIKSKVSFHVIKHTEIS